MNLVKCHLEQPLQYLSLFICTQRMVSSVFDLIFLNKSTFCIDESLKQWQKEQVNRFEFISRQGSFLRLKSSFQYFVQLMLCTCGLKGSVYWLIITGRMNKFIPKRDLFQYSILCHKIKLKSAKRFHSSLRLLLTLISFIWFSCCWLDCLSCGN